MINNTWSRKFVAAFVAAAVLTVYSMLALATPGARSGALSVIGEVTVNGQKVISGGTIFSDSVIVTAKDSSATVSLGKLGRIDLLPNSSLKLSFTDNSIVGLLDSGGARVSTAVGVSVNLATTNGAVVVDGSKATSFTVNTENGNTFVSTLAGIVELRSGTTVKQIAAGESGVAGTPQGKKDEDEGHGLHGGALAALLLAAGGAVAAIIWASTHKQDLSFGGSVIVVSPTK
jgi:hypothetical protein